MDDARLYVCPRCGEQVWICPRCDRGNQYCGRACSTAARRESVRAAGARYTQLTERTGANTRERLERLMHALSDHWRALR